MESIQAQSLSDFEFLICDDGSSVQAMSYLQSIAASDDRIKLVRQGNLFALPQKLNVCLCKAQGTYIARMDDDDYSHPDRLARQMAFLTYHPEITFVGCNVNLWRDGIVGQRLLPEYPTVRDFYFVQPYIHPAMLFRREALDYVGGYSEEKHAVLCEDYDLLLRLYAAGYQGGNLQECLLDYTIPATAKGNRRMKHRWNETVTRFNRFRELKQFPAALPYVVKPLLVGLIPSRYLGQLKQKQVTAIK